MEPDETEALRAEPGRDLVTLVTCTAGEMGEVLVPELAQLAAREMGKPANEGSGEARFASSAEALLAWAALRGAGVLVARANRERRRTRGALRWAARGSRRGGSPRG